MAKLIVDSNMVTIEPLLFGSDATNPFCRITVKIDLVTSGDITKFLKENDELDQEALQIEIMSLVDKKFKGLEL